MALLRRGLDPNAAAGADVALAVDDLIAMTTAADVEVSADGAYAELQTGEYAVQQAWSGDVLAAKRFGPGTDATLSRTGYTWPAGGVVGCDLTAICANGRNPVLAHAFVDYLMEEEVALDNFAWNGYQPPVASAVPEAFAEPSFPWSGVVPDAPAHGSARARRSRAGAVPPAAVHGRTGGLARRVGPVPGGAGGLGRRGGDHVRCPGQRGVVARLAQHGPSVGCVDRDDLERGIRAREPVTGVRSPGI